MCLPIGNHSRHEIKTSLNTFFLVKVKCFVLMLHCFIMGHEFRGIVGHFAWRLRQASTATPQQELDLKLAAQLQKNRDGGELTWESSPVRPEEVSR